MNYMVILAAALLIVAAGVASGDYDDPTISEDWPSFKSVAKPASPFRPD